MTATPSGQSPATDATPGINWVVFDELCAKRGATDETARAALVNIDRTTLWRWRKGKQRPIFANILTLADALETTVDKLTQRPA